MTRRYIAIARRPRAVECEDEWYETDKRSVEVIERESGPIDTGLLDEHGVTLYRVEDRDPVGFER